MFMNEERPFIKTIKFYLKYTKRNRKAIEYINKTEGMQADNETPRRKRRGIERNSAEATGHPGENECVVHIFLLLLL